MQRDMKIRIIAILISTITAATIGWVIGRAGLTVQTADFWIVLGLLLVYGLARYVEGLHS
jgi:hypothetical protein